MGNAPPDDCDRCLEGEPIGREPPGFGTGCELTASRGWERSTGEAKFREGLRGLLKVPLCCGLLMELLGSKGCLEGVVGSSVEAEVRVLDFGRNELYASELLGGCCTNVSVS